MNEWGAAVIVLMDFALFCVSIVVSVQCLAASKPWIDAGAEDLAAHVAGSHWNA